MSWVWSWFSGILSWLGLHNKKASILFLGLDNAGKTTLMDSLAHGHVRQHQPTQHTTSEDFTMGNIQFTIFDLGGHKEVRRAWRDHFAKADAIIYLVDAADPQRFQESRTELDQILSDDQLAQVPVLVLGNKIDARNAVSEQDFRHCMGLALTTGKRAAKLDANIRPLEVFMCTILMGQGYREGFQWLSKYIN